MSSLENPPPSGDGTQNKGTGNAVPASPDSSNSPASNTSTGADTPEESAPERREISVRSAPRFVPFLVLGGLLGVVVAAFIAYGIPGGVGYDPQTVFGFFMVLCAAGGVIVGGIVALVLDRLSVRRAKRAFVEPASDSDGAA